MLNGALVIEMVKNSFIESKKRKNWDMGSEKYIYLNIEFIRSAKEQECCQYLEQISASWEFILNLLQNGSMGDF